MDKLDEYLDQVCRRIGGTRAMRQHIRQELGEHLRDAAAGHRAAGMSEEDALARALEDFGGTDQVRSELEATHGHRLLAVAIDKAIDWKERTMKAKWLWMSWAHAALIVVVVFAGLAITFAEMFLVPKFEHIMHESWVLPAARNPEAAWLLYSLRGLHWVSRNLTWILLGSVVLWGLFEWRVHSENKPFMRLAGLGTVAAGLTLGLALIAATMLILLFLGLPGAIVGDNERVAGHLAVSLDGGVAAIEQGLAKKDWQTLPENAKRINHAIDMLLSLSYRAPDRPQPDAEQRVVSAHVARESLREAQQAITANDAAGVEAALQKFRPAYEPVRTWAAGLAK